MAGLITLVTNLVWPLTVLGIAALFRSQLVFLLGRLSTFKYGEFEVGFDRELRRAEAEARGAAPAGPASGKGQAAPGVLPESEPGRRAVGTDLASLYRLAILTPRGAIEEASKRLEAALVESVREPGASGMGRPVVQGWDDAVRRLGEKGRLTPEGRARLEHLRALAVWAARCPELESPRFADHARRYLDLTREVLAALPALAQPT